MLTRWTRAAMAFQAEGSACAKAWRHSGYLQRAAARAEAREAGRALNARLRGSDFIPEVLGRPRRGTKRALQLQKSCSEVSWVGLEQRG